MKPHRLIPILGLSLIGVLLWQLQQHWQVQPPTSQPYQVERVTDGDTLIIRSETGTSSKIRLCGIDAPEQKQALGKESKAFLQKLTLGKEVAIAEVNRDSYGRIVAEVFVLGNPEKFVNGDMVQAGMAYHYAKYSSDCPNKDVIIQAEAIAQQQRVGVWKNPNSTRPWNYRHTVGNK